MTDDWRTDPEWALADADAVYWKERGEKPPAKPPAAAELAQPPAWASLYDGRRLVATWTKLR